MDHKKLRQTIDQEWDETIVPTLFDYIKIPNKSPAFDPDWAKHGHMEAAVALLTDWVEKQNVPHLKMEVQRLPGRTPLIYIEIPGQSDRTVLLYGHLDKQPEMSGWDEDLGPWKPVLKGDKLYGRGGADDGYALFGSLTAIRALHAQNIPHARCVIIIEACEESGSFDLPFYIDYLQNRIGQPDLVICLDSMCGNYDQLWITTSLRGIVGGQLKVEILEQGVHSGYASGIVPSSFRIMRELLERVENHSTGEIQINECYVDIPEQRVEQAQLAAKVLGPRIINDFPFVKGATPVTMDGAQLLLNRAWRPALSVIGAEGLPPISTAGNVQRPSTTLSLSIRIPPGADAEAVQKSLKQKLEADPPYKARVTFTPREATEGWNAPAVAPWLEHASNEASKTIFGADAVYSGEGGSIPFMGMLGEKFPQAQFLITGVLGPQSNAHGPNEFLHIPTGKKVTACVAYVLAEHYRKVAL